MKRIVEPSNSSSSQRTDAAWKHTDPYPTWPFTQVDPKEMAKWARKNPPTHTSLDDIPESPF